MENLKFLGMHLCQLVELVRYASILAVSVLRTALLFTVCVSIVISYAIQHFGQVDARCKVTATLETETTRYNTQDRLQIRKQKSKTLLFTSMLAATLKPIRLECYLSRLSGAKQSEFVSSGQSGQILAAVRMGFECRCIGQNGCRFKHFKP